MIRKILTSLLCSSIIFTGATLSVTAQEAETTAQYQSATLIDEGMIGTVRWTLDSNGVLTIGSGEYEKNFSYSWPWSKYVDEITEVDGTASFTAIGDFSFCFRLRDESDSSAKPKNLRKIDLSGWDTSRVTSMRSMFYDCINLSDLNISSFDTTSVRNMRGMFWQCKSLSELDLNHFNTSSVTDMSEMFHECEGLISLDIDNFDTSQVTSMKSMFYGVSSLENLYLGSFNTSSVTSMYFMFAECHNLVTLGLSSFKVSSVTNMDSIFDDCYRLTFLDIGRWDTSKVETADRAFHNCNSLAVIRYSGNPQILFEALSEYSDDKWYQDTSGPYSLSDLPPLDPNEFMVPLIRDRHLIDLSEATFSEIDTSYPYTGKAITPVFNLWLNGTYLRKGIDYRIKHSNNTDPGTATIHIYGIGFYNGGTSINFEIIDPSITTIQDASLSNLNSEYPYSGEEIRPIPTVTLEENILMKDVDYSLTYANNINPGIATVTVTGLGRYSGSITREFTISPASISNATVTGINRSYTYDRNPIQPDPVIKIGRVTLVKGTDYTIAYQNNTNVGTATIVIRGIGNYSNSLTKDFSISPLSISGAAITGISNSYVYTGNTIQPQPVIKVGDATLTKGTDYTLSYSNNLNAGTATVSVQGIGNYSGSLSRTFTISRAPISDASITGIRNSYTFSGSTVRPDPVVKIGSTTLVKGTDYTLSYQNNTSPGNATVTIQGIGNYTGSISRNYTISRPDPVSINSATVTGISTSYTYNRSPIQPQPVVKVGSTTLVKGSDYTLAYQDNTNAGTATVTIRGIGDYTGTITRNFTISSASLSGASVTGISSSYTYSGSAVTPQPVVKLGNVTLIKGTDYSVSYLNNINSGTASMTIRGIGNYSGTITRSFSIVKPNPVSISKAAVSGISASYSWTGKAITPKPTVKINNKTLTEGTDYRCSYSNNINPGTATLTITGIGSYNGSLAKTFVINKAPDTPITTPISSATVSGISSQYNWTGKAITPKPVVKIGNTTLTEGNDYSLSFTNNVNPGTATITITGKGSYTSSMTKNFTIVKVPDKPVTTPISSAAVSGISSQYNWTGKAITPKPVIKIGSTTLTEGNDYSLSYTNNVNPGTATITITGKGTYTGSVTKNFTIVKAPDKPVTTPISSASVTAISSQYNWTGKAIAPKPVVKIGNTTLTEGRDYSLSYANNINPGTATITITGKGSYTGSISRTFTIVKTPPKPTTTSIGSAAVSGISAQYNWTGKAIAPKPVVKIGNATLAEGKDYSLSYANNVNPGKATITIKGSGKYSGSISRTFTIVKAPDKPVITTPISSASITGVAAQYSWIGKAITPKPTVIVGSGTLVEGKDYSLSYTNNVNPGSATITIKGAGKYSGTILKSFMIVKPAATNPSVAMHRLYNPNSGEHFYTSSDNEKNSLVKAGWKFEGKGWTAPKTSNTPVYRLYNANAGDHHYTLDKKERDALVVIGWKYEGIGWYSDDKKAVPLYRQYNPNAKAGSHNYTTNKAENDQLVRIGWKAEGIGWYGMSEIQYNLTLADIAGTYEAPANANHSYRLQINSDGTFKADFREYHVFDNFTDKVGRGSAWGVQIATGKIRLIKENASTIGTYQIYNVKLTYPHASLIKNPINPDGTSLPASAAGLYFGEAISSLKEGSTFLYYSPSTRADQFPNPAYNKGAQFCAPGGTPMLLKN